MRKICRSSPDLPANLMGYSCWLQLRDGITWDEVCPMRPADARNLLRYLDRHVTALGIRISIEKVG